MATLVSANGGGNWTTAATWRAVCTGSGALLTTLSAAQSITSTTYQASVAFTVTNTEVIEGVALHLQRSGTTGTLTVGLSDDGGSTYTREVTVNLSDLPSAYSWVFFKFSSTLTADGGSDYKVAIKLSTGSSGVSIYRGSGTSNDWSHILREDSAPGSLAAGDVFYIWDDLTGAGAKTANTVTMNNTDTTDFGAVTVGFGTLSYGVSASTNYYLKISGDLTVWGGGTFNIGTVGGAMPATSTAVLELDPTSDGEFGLIFKDGSIPTAQGASMTRVWDLLNADAAANATSLTTANSTGWSDNDQIVIASTSRTPGETELGTMNGAASGTTLTVDGFGGTGGGVAYAHSGITGTQAEIINLTRNVKIRSATSTVMAYVYISATATVDLDYIEIYYVGENVSNKRGIEVATTTGSCNIQYCSLHDTEDWGLYIASASGSNITFSNNVAYNLNTSKGSNQRGVTNTSSTGVSTLSGNVFLAIQSANQTHAIYFNDNGLIFTNNRMAGFTEGAASVAVIYGEADATLGTCSGNVSHSHDGYAWGHTGNVGPGSVVDTLTAYRTAGTYGIYSPPSSFVPLTYTSADIRGAGTTACILGYGSLIFSGCTVDSDSAHATSNGVYVSTTGGVIRFINSTLGSNTVFASAGISVGGFCQMYLYNTTVSNPTEVVGQSNMRYGSFIHSYKHDQSGTTHKNWYQFGNVFSEQITRHTESGYAWKLTSNNASYKLVFSGPTTFDTFKAAVTANAGVTVTAWVRKDSSYNGNAPRLVLVGGYIGGIAADVTASLTVAADTWEQLSVSGTPNEAGVIEFYVDCDGTAGNVYVDDMAVSQSGLPSAGNLDYPVWGLPIPAIYTVSAAASGGLLTHPGMSGGLRG